MKIISNYATPNFQARVKLKAPNVQKIKQSSVKSMQKPETQKALASTGVSLAGTASIAGGFAMEPDKFHPSLQSLGEVQDATLSLGTAVSTSPLVPMLVGGCNDLSGTNSSASVEEFLFDKIARKKQYMMIFCCKYCSLCRFLFILATVLEFIVIFAYPKRNLKIVEYHDAFDYRTSYQGIAPGGCRCSSSDGRHVRSVRACWRGQLARRVSLLSRCGIPYGVVPRGIGAAL